MQYLSTDNFWYSEKVLKEFHGNGEINPNFNETAARDTHIAKPTTCP